MAGQTETKASFAPGDSGWAWSRYEPDAHRPWTLAMAGHLYRRAAFAANWSQLQQALSDGPQRTVDRLLTPGADIEAFNRTYDGQEGVGGAVDGLRAWWLRRMIETPHPLLEKMTLFWHSHFATNAAGLTNPQWIQSHVALLRSHALGSFDALLREIARDPALLIGLGADVNRKASANEGFVRPLMETFTLGPGHFTDDDVRQAATAFTGWYVLRGRFRYLAQEHDETAKHVLGQEGDFTGDDVLRIVLEQPATSRTIVRKLYRQLISETEEPDEALIAPLAESFARNYSISKLVETILRSNLFFSARSYRQRIKSPAEFAIGLVRAMEGMVSTTQLAQDLGNLGQDLCHPPTVRGWAGGQYWVNAATLAGRANLVRAMLRGEEPYGARLDPQAIARKHGHTTPESVARFLIELLLQGGIEPVVQDVLLHDVLDGEPSITARRLSQAVATLPEYHLA